MKKSIAFFVCALLLCAGMAQGRPQPQRLGLPQPMPGIGPLRVPSGMRSLDEDTLHNVDILNYQLAAQVDITAQTLNGHCTISLQALEDSIAETWISLHSFTIDSVHAEGHSLDYIRGGNDSLTLIFEPALAAEETTEAEIFYHGHPQNDGFFGGFFFRTNVAFSMGDGFSIDPPPTSHYFMPCYLNPCDKATFESWWRVTTSRTVSSNGVLVDTLNHGDGTKTWHYRLDQPVSTYLMSVAIGNYIIGVQQEEGPRIEYFVYPSHQGAAQIHFSNIPAILEGYVARFGSYPFDRMSYAETMTPGTGDMEHVTCVHHHQGFVQGNHTYDWLLAHEMSHMWWGNWVTLGEWEDLWLNEGFATYCEALAMEHLSGQEAYDSYVASKIVSPYLSSGETFPIYDPVDYWSETVYQKGGAVMHMLRRLLGDSLFFAAWRSFGEHHAFGNAVTDDWQNELEAASGQDLDWFFQQWVYGWGYPRYYYSVYRNYYHPHIVYVYIRQAQTTQTFFRMPIELRFNYSSGGDTTLTIWNDAVAQQLLEVSVPDSFVSVDFDPRRNILCRAWGEAPAEELPSVVGDFHFYGAYPNPFNSAVCFEFNLPKVSDVRLRLFDVLGREVTTLSPGLLHPGKGRILWQADGFPSGIYFAALEAGEFSAVTKVFLLK